MTLTLTLTRTRTRTRTLTRTLTLTITLALSLTLTLTLTLTRFVPPGKRMERRRLARLVSRVHVNLYAVSDCAGLHYGRVKVPPWQCPSSAPALLRARVAAPGGSRHPR